MKKIILSSIFLLMSLTVSAQFGKIQGKLTTADGEVAGFANITLLETSIRTQTDESGRFTLSKIPSGTYSLEARYIGFDPIVQPVTVIEGQTVTLDIRLKETSNELEEVVVKGYVGYRKDVTNLATRTATPLIQIPQSVQVIPQQILRDQQAFNINEAIRNVAGMSLFSTYQDYNMRGFRSNDGNFAYNGVRGALYQFDLPGQLYNIERIEAIKGPASSLFSNSSPGGIINIVTKQPLPKRNLELKATYGTFNQFRFSADATGPINSKLLYRLIVGYENSGAISRIQKINHLFIAPSLLYKISEKTTALLEVNLYNDRRTVGYERGIFAAQRADGSYNLEAVPIRWTRHNSNDFSKTKGLSSQLKLSHEFSRAVSLHGLVRSITSEQEQQEITSNFNSLVIEGNDTLKNRSLQYFHQKPLYSFQANVYAESKFRTGPLQHTFIGGIDAGTAGRNYDLFSWDAPSIYTLAPDFSNDFPLNKADSSLRYGGETRERTQLLGGYVQDQIEIFRKLQILLGLRYDTYHYTNDYIDTESQSNNTEDKSDAKVLLPRLGIVYQPVKTLSLYGSYSVGFQPQYSNLQKAGGPFDPEKGKQYEFGAKVELLNGRLLSTLALYRLDKENILIPDPSDENGEMQLSDGKARSKGMEITIQGNITDNVSLITNYSYNETKNLKGGEFGVRENGWYPNAPINSASTWIKYSFTKGVLERLNLSGGFQFVDKRNTFTPDFALPAYTTFDAAVNYSFKGASIGLNFYNLTDKRHYIGGYGRGIFWAGMPRSFRATLVYNFN